MTTTSRTAFTDPEMPSTPLVIRAEPRRVTECPDCGARIGSMRPTCIVCPYSPRKAES